MTAKLSQVLLALVLERFFRFTTYLEDVSLICSDSERHLVEFFDELLRQVNEREIKRAARILCLPELVEAEESDAINLLILAVAHMDILLSETEVFPRQRPLLEVYDFLEKAFPKALSDGWQLAVVLWPIYNFSVEPDLAERLKERLDWMIERPSKHVVLYLAEIERNDPTMWALLAHEIGHALDEAEKIGDNVFEPGAPTQIEELPRWITELIADNIAIRVLGPAYFCAFASLTLLDDNPRTFYSSHPALHKRLEMLKRELELMDVLDGKTKEVVNGYYQLVTERTRTEPESPEDKLINWEEIFNKINNIVDKEAEKLHKFDGQDRKRSESLVDLLQKGTPISSFLDEERHRSINEKAKQLLGDLRETSGFDRQKRLDEFKRRLNEIIDDVIEEPTDPIWVLNAGWIDRWDKIKKWDPRLGSPSDWQEWLSKTDTILRKSIEAIPIHEGLGRNRNDPQ